MLARDLRSGHPTGSSLIIVLRGTNSFAKGLPAEAATIEDAAADEGDGVVARDPMAIHQWRPVSVHRGERLDCIAMNFSWLPLPALRREFFRRAAQASARAVEARRPLSLWRPASRPAANRQRDECHKVLIRETDQRADGFLT